jgi:hypothetical protein
MLSKIPEAHLLVFTSYAGPPIEEAAPSAGIEAFVEKGDRTKLLKRYIDLNRFSKGVSLALDHR